MRKIFIAIGLAIIMIAETVFAESTASATLYYYRDDTFYVIIPDSIQVGEENYITADSLNIGVNKHVNVSLENNESFVTIYHTSDESQSVDVYFQNENGDTVGSGNPAIVSFGKDESGISKYFRTYVSGADTAAAGEYTGTVTFRVYCE
jgi:hypothetical protein